MTRILLKCRSLPAVTVSVGEMVVLSIGEMSASWTVDVPAAGLTNRLYDLRRRTRMRKAMPATAAKVPSSQESTSAVRAQLLSFVFDVIRRRVGDRRQQNG